MGDHPEAWFDLAAMQAMLNKTNEALTSLKACLTYEAKRKSTGQVASSHNLIELSKTDPRFAALRASPTFQEMLNSIGKSSP